MKTLVSILTACAIAMLLHKAKAQIPAATLFQTPLQIHPGLAGNTGKHRFCVLANQNDYYLPVKKEPLPYRELNEILSYRTVYSNAKNVYASYDGLWKGYGIGVFATYSSVPKSTNTNAYYRQQFGEFEHKGYSLGAVISPKLTVYDPVLKNEARYTVAPTLSVNYKTGNERSVMFMPDNTFYSLKSVYYSKHAHFKQITTSLGGIVNSKRGYAGYNLGVVYDFTKESVSALRDTLNIQKDFKNSYLAMQHSFTIGLVFPKKEGSKFSFTPVTVAGFSNNLSGNKKAARIYQSQVQTGINWFGYLHQSLNFRLKRILFGGSYTECLNQRIGAYHVGYKANSFRVTCFYSFWDTNTRKMEAALSVTF